MKNTFSEKDEKGKKVDWRDRETVTRKKWQQSITELLASTSLEEKKQGHFLKLRDVVE